MTTKTEYDLPHSSIEINTAYEARIHDLESNIVALTAERDRYRDVALKAMHRIDVLTDGHLVDVVQRELAMKTYHELRAALGKDAK